MAGLLGCEADEVVATNVDASSLDFVIARFYHPVLPRRAMLAEWTAGALVRGAMRRRIVAAGFDPDRFLALIRPRWSEDFLRAEDVTDFVQRYGHEYAVVLLTIGVDVVADPNELTSIVDACHRAGCIVGVDATQLVGISPLSLHDWGVDFAVWRTDRHLCSGESDSIGLFVHSRHRSPSRDAEWDWIHPTRPNWSLQPFYSFVRCVRDVGIDIVALRTAEIRQYLQSQLVSIPGVELVAQRSGSFSAGVAVRVRPNASEVSERLRFVHNIFVATIGSNCLLFTPSALYNTASDCDRAVVALQTELTSTPHTSATSP